jgi:predicted nuclease of predicted toxin-antitoxin system
VGDIRFYADQHFPMAVSKGLLQLGLDVVTAQAVGRCGFSDADQLAFASGEGRVLLTFDADFLDPAVTGVDHAGIAWCEATKYAYGELIQMVSILYAVVSADEMKNRIEYL